MPWTHCEAEFILDTEDCPACGISKATWTIQFDATRTFVISSPNKKKGKAWIELALQDAAGKAYAGQTYRCVFANDRSLEGVLDAKGVARLRRPYPGALKIEFPKVDMTGATWSEACQGGAASKELDVTELPGLSKERVRAGGEVRYRSLSLPPETLRGLDAGSLKGRRA